jgi:hypothetical protein
MLRRFYGQRKDEELWLLWWYSEINNLQKDLNSIDDIRYSKVGI